MTNRELQIAIDSLLDFLKPPTSSYVTLILEHLKKLTDEQEQRAKRRTREFDNHE